ncbi:protein kinase domain-containing protein [Stigmatella erecta]|uniref:Serine/threonine protein kinase n=1 Tax=Stigmatella erecta TaxID=83460 RepID=A0A1H9ZIC5_9BACT|nr:protein kinase [Stigmatella erecta]SES81392.1 serine/threonine protein kinase [Stigmatella erecta]
MGTYRIIRRLAVGGMAEVFLGKMVGAEGFEKPVAVKRILPSFGQDESFIHLFLREAKVCVALQHANVVQVLDLGAVKGQYYMVMEFVDGENLRALLKAARTRPFALGLREVCFITQQVAEGLAYAHSRADATGTPLNIVHRDVNPSNVMIGGNGEIKLADFGIAKVADGHQETQAGVLKGKINYLSPEQVLSRPVDQRSDIFLLGLLLHELLSGKQLLQGTQLQIVQQLSTFNERALEPIPGVPAPLWSILQRALAFSPAGRFRTAQELSSALQSFLFDHRLRVGTTDIASLFGRAFPARRSPLEDLAGARGEEIHLENRDTPRGVAPPVLQPFTSASPFAATTLIRATPAPGSGRAPGPPPLPRPAQEPTRGAVGGEPVPAPYRSTARPRAGRRIGDILLARGMLTADKLEQALVLQKRAGGKLGQVLVGERLVEAEDLVRALSEQSGLPHISSERLHTMPIPVELTRLMPMELCEKLCAVPVALRSRELYCAMLEPRDLKVLDALKFATGSISVHGLFATEPAIRRAIRRFYLGEEAREEPEDKSETSLNRERVLNFVERFTGRTMVNLDLEAEPLDEPSLAPPRPSPALTPPPVPSPPARPPLSGSSSRARMVLVVGDTPEPVHIAVKLLLHQGIAAAESPAGTAEKALALGGYDLVLVLEDAVADPPAAAARLRAAYPGVGVRCMPSLSTALLGEGGPLARQLAVHARMLESAVAMMGGSAMMTPLLVRLARRCAVRLGAGSVEESLAGTAAAALALGARMEEASHFVLPSLARVHSLVGSELPEVAELLTAVLSGGAEAGPPTDRLALAVLAATAFVLQTQSAQPSATEVIEALLSLRKSQRLTPAALEALAQELGSGTEGVSSTAPRVVVVDNDLSTALTLQLRLMADGLGMKRVRTLAEVEQSLAGAQAAILEAPLPDGDVHALLRVLRASPATAHLPVFLIVPREDPSGVMMGIDAGADDVLVRPVNVEVLMAKLRRAMAHQHAVQRAGGHFS